MHSSTDADTNQPFAMHRPGPLANTEMEDELSGAWSSTLEPWSVRNEIRASVNVDYDTSSSEENQETYNPRSAAAVTMQTSRRKRRAEELIVEFGERK